MQDHRQGGSKYKDPSSQQEVDQFQTIHEVVKSKDPSSQQESDHDGATCEEGESNGPSSQQEADQDLTSLQKAVDRERESMAREVEDSSKQSSIWKWSGMTRPQPEVMPGTSPSTSKARKSKIITKKEAILIKKTSMNIFDWLKPNNIKADAVVEAKGVNEMEVEIKEQLEDSAKEERLERVKQRKEQWLEMRRIEDNIPEDILPVEEVEVKVNDMGECEDSKDIPKESSKLKPYKKSFIATKKIIKHKIKIK